MNWRTYFGSLTLLVACICIGLSHGRTSKELRVKLSDGSGLIGKFLVSLSGRGICAFLGVPYAQAPVGELRFKAPLPQLPWQGYREANKDGQICSQRDPFRRRVEVIGGEDCLFLHVYTPHRPATTKPLAVMVFFHGGGFMMNAGTKEYYGPEHLLDHDIVFVGVNYRMGPLGFLSTGQQDCPGNNGLKDQNRALRWVQENIGAFGGNPKEVTIFGESAGGASVTYHMTSPLSKGLFHRGISQSGVNLNPWAQPAHTGVAVRRAERFARMLGCPKGINWATTLDCIRQVDVFNVTTSFYDFFEWDTDPMVPFPPVVEPDLPGAFLTEHPRNIEQPHGLSIPWITGVNADEGTMKSAPILNLPGLADDFNKQFDLAMSVGLYYNHHSDKAEKTIRDELSAFYFSDKMLCEATHQNLSDIFGDAWFLAGMDEYLRIRLGQGKAAAPTYVYLYAHASECSFTEVFQGGDEKYYGVSHAEELQNLFPVGPEMFPNAVTTELDEQVRRNFVALWVNFARTGDPNQAADELAKSHMKGVPHWKPAVKHPLDYLRIGTKDFEGQPLLEMETGLYEQRTNLWRRLGAHLPARNGDFGYRNEL